MWWMEKTMACFSRKKNLESKSEREKRFIVNGSLLLEKLVAFCDGKSCPIYNFSTEELKTAITNYDEQKLIMKGRFFNFYKGYHQGRPIIVKKYPRNSERAFSDIVYSSGMSVHGNALKLLGCCLETQCPVLVFESAKEKTLEDRIHGQGDAQFQPMPWKTRLKIAVDIANAVVYLHTAFQRPIVHRNIKPSNVFLDENDKGKLSDFSLSVAIPEGESHVEEYVAGTFGYIAPDSYHTGYFSEKSDVYSFGVFLLVLLTGQRPVDVESNSRLHDLPQSDRSEEIVDPHIVAEGTWPGKEQQLEAVKSIAFLCISDSEEDRPTMIEVAKELRNTYRPAIAPC